MTERLLVTGAGGPSAVSFMRALSDDGSLELYAGDIDPYAAGLYIVPEARRWILRRGADPAFVDDLLARCMAAGITVLVPTVDFELLPIARRRSEFERAGIRLILAPAETFRVCLDKWTLVSECAGVCAVPTTVVIDSAFDGATLPRPFLIKPRRGAGARGVRLLDDVSALGDCPRDGSMVAQEYLGGHEYSVDVLSDTRASVLSVVARSRLKIDSGIAVAGRTLRDERLESAAAAVARHLGITFVSNIQFREDAAGTPKLMDVNARFPGTMPLTVASGVNMPRLALDLVLGRSVGVQAPAREVAMMRTWQEQFVSPGEIARLEAAARALISS